MICVSFFPIYLLIPIVLDAQSDMPTTNFQYQDAYAKLEPLDANQKSLTTVFVCLAPRRLKR